MQGAGEGRAPRLCRGVVTGPILSHGQREGCVENGLERGWRGRWEASEESGLTPVAEELGQQVDRRWRGQSWGLGLGLGGGRQHSAGVSGFYQGDYNEGRPERHQELGSRKG